jgi:ABC-type dipeptide/oligopeptide/nickel transport system permease component
VSVYILRRLITSVISIVAIVSFVFLVVHLTPGDPVDVILGEYWTPEMAVALRNRLGLDKPLWMQYATYTVGVLRGDLGDSFRTGRPVIDDILSQYPHTIRLAVASLSFSVVLGIPLGVISALRRNTLTDLVAMVSSLVWLSVPSFWFGLLLILFLSVHLPIFPVTGAGDPASLSSTLHHIVLPAIALGARMAALVARMTRSAMLDVLGEDFVRTARAKGLSGRVVTYRHALRNALIPIISITGLDAISLLGGSVVTEIVFSRPGVGSLLIAGVSQRDYPVIIGILYFFVTAVVILNFLTDLLYAAVDPRIRLGAPA